MTIHTTSNLGIPFPDGVEAVSNGPQDFLGFVEVLDAGANGPTAMLWQKGVLASKPAASTVPIGGVYHCTDVACMFISDGASWHYVPLDGNAQPVGTMLEYAGTTAPIDQDGVQRWVMCDGTGYSSATYPLLFNVIAYTYGGSSGTFNVPDCRGRVPVGANPTGANGLSVRTLAQSGGEETHTLVSGEVPSHVHAISTGQSGLALDDASTGVGINGTTSNVSVSSQSASPVGIGNVASSNQTIGQVGSPSSVNFGQWTPYDSAGSWTSQGFSHTHAVLVNDPQHTHALSDSGHLHTLNDPGHNHSGATGSYGSGSAHNNMQPFSVLNWIIKAQ